MIRFEFLTDAPRTSTMPIEFGRDIVTTALRELGAKRIRLAPSGTPSTAPKVTRLLSAPGATKYVVNSMAAYFSDAPDEDELIPQWCLTATVAGERVWFYALPGYPMMMGTGPVATDLYLAYSESFFLRLFDGKYSS